MGSQETRWDECETQLSTASARRAEAVAEVPGLTVLAHTDPRRVGERLALPALAAGGQIRLSRLEPVFRAPGRPGESPRPLEVRHLSRQPIRLAGGAEPGSVALDASATRTPVVADGEAVDGRRVFSATDLERGVALQLGSRVVLLLHRMPAGPPPEVPRFGLVGESIAMLRLRREIALLAPLDVPVLLTGETGTGKELVARALHEAGPRRERPYVAVNMGVLSPSLAAAELFGAARGAYTGADREKAGYFRSARNGTLFLDEIGETPPEVQVMLLRALESREIRPLGSTEALEIEVRIIAATDADLEAAITAGRFRAPLYHRLASYSIRLPALRERRDDIGRLFYYLLSQELAELGESAPLTEDRPWPPAELVARICRYDWPGNVRELKNVALRLAIAGPGAAPEVLASRVEELLGEPARGVRAVTSAGETLTASPPAKSAVEDPPRVPARRRRLRKPADVSDEELLAALEAHSFKIQLTAEALGLSRINLYRRMEECPAVRKAADIGSKEIETVLARCGGDLEAAATELRISLQGLKRRITALGLVSR